ncbi:hypothetical protein EMIT0P43_60128 [Pseudomonas jessenii]
MVTGKVEGDLRQHPVNYSDAECHDAEGKLPRFRRGGYEERNGLEDLDVFNCDDGGHGQSGCRDQFVFGNRLHPNGVAIEGQRQTSFGV